MTQFNPQNKETLTYGECLDPIFKITDKEDAEQYKKAYIAFIQKWRDREGTSDNMTAEQVANSNIGYYAGYGSSQDRERIEALFLCAHPIFGAIKDNGTPTGKEAFECGNKGKTLTEVRY